MITRPTLPEPAAWAQLHFFRRREGVAKPGAFRQMRGWPGAAGVACGLVSFSLLSAPVSAQNTFAARLSVDTVEVGEAFSLLVRVPVPAGSLVHFPDTVARTDFLESQRPVQWQAEPDASGGALLTLKYPVLAFGVGIVPVPGFDVFVQAAGGRVDGTPIPGNSFVGPWSEAPHDGGADVRPLRVPRRGVWVNPVFTPEDLEVGVQPRPSADVVGRNWHRNSLLAGLAFLAALAFLLVRTIPAWIGRLRGLDGEGAQPWTPEASRRHALDELERLRAEGLAAGGRMHELYTRSSWVVRQYLSRVNPELRASLTSSELMGRLDDTERALEHASLSREMTTAEVVKFGRLRPAEEAADEHLRSLRTWVQGPGTPTQP